jgi:acetyltransferase
MDVHHLDRIFNPHRIALIGVTTNPNSVGGKVLGNLVASGFRGVVYPVNPDNEAVLGIQCYPDVAHLPRTPDLGVICTAAEKVPGIVRSCGQAGILGIIIISSGFKETGPHGKALEEEILAIKNEFPGMRILGPNCLGIIVPSQKLNLSFASGMAAAGHVAFISQSGALCASVLDWALEEKIGFSYFVSVGNALDVGFGDLIDYFGEDEKSNSMILYMESIANARKFMTAARAFARTKPIVVYKAGRFPESAQVAASHTGAMAAEDAIYDAAFQRIGVSRVLELGEIFDCAELVGQKKTSKGHRLAIITNAGGPGVIATDALIATQGTLATLSTNTITQLNETLPPAWSHGNPIDVLGDSRSKRMMKATGIVLADKNVDAVLVILTPQAMTNPTPMAKALAKLAETTNKPILAVWLGGTRMKEGIRLLNEAGVPTYSTPEQGVRAFMTLVEYSRNLETLYETPKDIPVQFPILGKPLPELWNAIVADSSTEAPILSEEKSKTLLEYYGIPTTRPRAAATAQQAVALANEIGYPVVLKILSPAITHKSDVCGVLLDLLDGPAVSEAFEQITTQARIKQPDANITGVTVQPMVKMSNAVEMILGIKYDPIFGTVILVGTGGIMAELFNDRVIGFPPLNERLARNMLESLKIWPLLQGYRGKPPVNIDKLVETLIRLSYLAANCPEISELDINPLLVGEKEVMALDARVVIDPERIEKNGKLYDHLSLKPYPEEYVRQMQMEDGTSLTLRPIKPEDEPLWMEMLSKCSRETIYARFRYFFRWESHETATHYCYIDYDREIAIVAELNEKGKRRLVGVGRLIAAPDHETAEYAVLITDDWQNKGLGNILTDYCLEIADKWDVKRMVAETTTDNHRMIAVLKSRGFDITMGAEHSLVEVSKILK